MVLKAATLSPDQVLFLLWERMNLTLEEAAAYTGIGTDKLRELSNRESCDFVLWVGTKRLLKRKQLEEFLIKSFSI